MKIIEAVQTSWLGSQQQVLNKMSNSEEALVQNSLWKISTNFVTENFLQHLNSKMESAAEIGRNYMEEFCLANSLFNDETASKGLTMEKLMVLTCQTLGFMNELEDSLHNLEQLVAEKGITLCEPAQTSKTNVQKAQEMEEDELLEKVSVEIAATDRPASEILAEKNDENTESPVETVAQTIEPATDNVESVAEITEPVNENTEPVDENTEPVDENTEPTVESVQPEETPIPEAKTEKIGGWSDGVGFGHINDNLGWDIQSWETNISQHDTPMIEALNRIANAVMEQKPDPDTLRSCLFPLLHYYCKNDSLNDMAKHFDLYQAVYGVCTNLISYPDLLPLFEETYDQLSLYERLRAIYGKAKILCTMSNVPEDVPDEIAFTGATNNDHHDYDDDDYYDDYDPPQKIGFTCKSANETFAFDTAVLVCKCVESLEAAIGERDEEANEEDDDERASSSESLGSKMSLDNYIPIMREVCFGTVDEIFANHHFFHKKGEVVTLNRKLIKTLAAEFADFPGGLPINPESSVFFRACESNMPYCQMLIIPCDGTPYSGGCFLFDVCFPTNYPLVPPLVNLQTTGSGTVRFNPNLYECGKVCLSLLNTWGAANDGERWNPGLSTFLQVAISIQSLIFVPEPYFNEPGYEQDMYADYQQEESKRYNKNIINGTVNFAIIDMIKNPPAAFRDIVLTHFKLSSERTLSNVVNWLGDDHPKTLEVKALLENL